MVLFIFHRFYKGYDAALLIVYVCLGMGGVLSVRSRGIYKTL